MFRKALAVSFCLFLAWRAGAALVLIAAEVRSYEGALLVDAVSLTEEERIHRALQADHEILTLLRARASAGGLVLFVTGSELAAVQRAMRVGLLLYPPRHEMVAHLPAGLPQGIAPRGVPVFAVDFVGELAAHNAWELIATRPTFRLWRFRTPQPEAPS